MKTKLFTILICLIMGMSTPSIHAADKAAPKDTTVVIAEGVGINRDKALLKAMRNAVQQVVQQVVGVIVDAETLIKNDKVVKDQILDFSNGFVEKFEKLKEGKNDDGLYEVTIKATVKRRQLYDRLKKTKVIASATVDGGSLFGEAMSKNEAEKKGAKLLEKALLDLKLPGSLLSTEILNQKPEIIGRDQLTIKARWRVRVKFDLEKYKKTVFPKLKQVLSEICIKKIPGPLVQDPNSHLIRTANYNWPKDRVWKHMDGLSSSLQLGRSTDSAVILLLEDFKPETGKQIYHGFRVDKEVAAIFQGYQAGTLGIKTNVAPDPRRRFALSPSRAASLIITLLDSEGRSLEQTTVNMLGKNGPFNSSPGHMIFREGGRTGGQQLVFPFVYGSHYLSTSVSRGDSLRGTYTIAPYFVGVDVFPKTRIKQYCDYVWTPTLKLEDVKKAKKLTAEIKLK